MILCCLPFYVITHFNILVSCLTFLCFRVAFCLMLAAIVLFLILFSFLFKWLLFDIQSQQYLFLSSIVFILRNITAVSYCTFNYWLFCQYVKFTCPFTLFLCACEVIFVTAHCTGAYLYIFIDPHF